MASVPQRRHISGSDLTYRQQGCRAILKHATMRVCSIIRHDRREVEQQGGAGMATRIRVLAGGFAVGIAAFILTGTAAHAATLSEAHTGASALVTGSLPTAQPTPTPRCTCQKPSPPPTPTPSPTCTCMKPTPT